MVEREPAIFMYRFSTLCTKWRDKNLLFNHVHSFPWSPSGTNLLSVLATLKQSSLTWKSAGQAPGHCRYWVLRLVCILSACHLGSLVRVLEHNPHKFMLRSVAVERLVHYVLAEGQLWNKICWYAKELWLCQAALWYVTVHGNSTVETHITIINRRLSLNKAFLNEIAS